MLWYTGWEFASRFEESHRFLIQNSLRSFWHRNFYVRTVSIKHILASQKLTEYNRVRKRYVKTAYCFNLRLFDDAALVTCVYAVQNWMEMDIHKNY